MKFNLVGYVTDQQSFRLIPMVYTQLVLEFSESCVLKR